jgi:hypothetical protein
MKVQTQKYNSITVIDMQGELDADSSIDYVGNS